MARKVVQIAVAESQSRTTDETMSEVSHDWSRTVVALCDDGSMWMLLDNAEAWEPLPDVPQ